MSFLELAKLAGAVSVPIITVAGLFFGMMKRELAPIREELKALRIDVHAIDVRLAQLEVRLEERSPANENLSHIPSGRRAVERTRG